MKNVLIIGGCGFIGSHLVERLKGRGVNVAVLVRDGSDISFVKGLNVELRRGDLLDRESLELALDGVDTVFCAANVKPSGKSKKDYENELLRVHIEGTKNLLAASRGVQVRKIVYFSSVAAMGYDLKVKLYDENFKEAPIDVYGKAKLEAERILNSAKSGVAVTILRPPGVFGERGLGAMSKIIALVNKGLVPVLGSGRNKQSISYVGNIVNQAIIAASDDRANGKTYIAGDTDAYSVNELIDAVSAAMNRKIVKVYIPFFLVIVAASILNAFAKLVLRRELVNKESLIAIATERIFATAKITQELNYRQEFDLKESAKRTVFWSQGLS
jgi:nucleoside-diphosphate-sugar epimerase